MILYYFTIWADTGLSRQQHKLILDLVIQRLLQQIVEANGNSYAGCWDVIGRNKETVLFAELKRYKKYRL